MNHQSPRLHTEYWQGAEEKTFKYIECNYIGRYKQLRIRDNTECFEFHMTQFHYLRSPQVLNSIDNCSTRTKTKDPNSRYQRPNKSFLGIAITVQHGKKQIACFTKPKGIYLLLSSKHKCNPTC